MSNLIRRAKPTDDVQVQTCIKAVYDEYGFGWFPESYHLDLYTFESSYFCDGHSFWVAESPDGQVVGTIALVKHPSIPIEDAAEDGVAEVDGVRRVAGTDCSVERLYVHPDARRQGIARALMDAILAEAKEWGCTGMEVWSDKKFFGAHALYQGMGAEPVGDRLCHDPDQSPEWGFRLPV